MLADFLVERRSQVLARCLAKIRGSVAVAHDKPSDELIDDLTHFYDELIGALRRAAGSTDPASGLETTGNVASKHAAQRWRIGFDITEVIHDYGFMCDAITEAAQEGGARIEVFEYRVMNQSIDTAIAEAVSEYQRQRDAVDDHRGERLGSIVHELRNALSTSVLSVQAIREGRLSIAGRTADALERSLRRQQQLIDYLINDVRLRTGELKKSALQLAQLFEEIEAAAAVHARTKDIRLSANTDHAIEIDGDRLLLTSALMNLALNAIKYTPRGGQVHIRGRQSDGVACIEVEDECGGLPGSDRDHEELFEPFVQQHADRAGLGLGLSITRESIEAHGGTVGVRNLPGKGCIFVLQVPIRRANEAAVEDVEERPSQE